MHSAYELLEYAMTISDRIEFREFADVCVRCDGAGVLQLNRCRSAMNTCPDCDGYGVAQAAPAVEDRELVAA